MCSAPPTQQPLQRDLEARDVFLDQQELGGVPADLDVVARQERRDAPERGDELVHVVGADDAAAGRERQRLEHAGIAHTPRAARKGSSLSAMRRKRGIGTPAAARHWRIWNLSRAAVTAATGFGAQARGRPRWPRAATVVRSSTRHHGVAAGGAPRSSATSAAAARDR